MEVFHVGDKVFLDDVKYKYYNLKRIDTDTEGNQKVFLDDIKDYRYGKVIAVDIEDNLMGISPINDKLGIMFSVHIDSPHIQKIDFVPKDHVVIHDLMKDYCNKRGIVDAYNRAIDRYRVIIDNEPHWFAPFELTLEDDVDKKDKNTDGFVASFSCFSPIKVRLSDDGKKAFEYHFGVKPPVDAQGRTEFTNLAYLMEVYDSTFIYDDKYMFEDDEILVKEMG